jgi:hypothetical protein
MPLRGYQPGDDLSSLRDLDLFTALDMRQYTRGVLVELPDRYLFHSRQL